MQPVLLLLCLALLAVPSANADEPKEFEPALVKMKPLAADPKDDELHKLLKERFNVALAEMQVMYTRVLAGNIGIDGLFESGSRLEHAGLEVFADPKEKIALLEKYLELVKEVERITVVREKAGRVGIEEIHRARYYRLDTEIALLRLKGKAEGKPK